MFGGTVASSVKLMLLSLSGLSDVRTLSRRCTTAKVKSGVNAISISRCSFGSRTIPEKAVGAEDEAVASAEGELDGGGCGVDGLSDPQLSTLKP
jgi:hypothetical protein